MECNLAEQGEDKWNESKIEGLNSTTSLSCFGGKGAVEEKHYY